MGTRHQIKVIYKGEVKVLQYGQWDGYPNGQGADIATFFQRKNLNLDKFKKQVGALQFLTKEECEKLDEDKEWHRKYPWLSRDAGAKVLGYIQSGKAKKLVKSDEEENKQWCEYFYTIDLDKDTIQKSSGPKGGKRYKLSEWTHELCSRLK